MPASSEVSTAPGRRSVLVVWRHGDVDATACTHHEAVLGERLRRLYRPYLGGDLTVTTRSVPAAGVTVGVADEYAGRAELHDVVIWGDPVGVNGPATVAEVRAALTDDEQCRNLLGSFVLVQMRDADVILRTSSDLVHTLKHCSGPHGEAWATQGFAAVVASGRRPSVVPERVPEFVVYDFVFADDELLDGVRVLTEASSVRLDAHGAQETSYWPTQDRLCGGVGDAATLRTVLVETLCRLTERPGLHLALTAGRDSTLLASCLAEAGRSMPSFTFGNMQTADGVGAAAVAAQLGWPHVFVGQQQNAAPSLDRLLAATRWSEGMDTGWNFYPPPLDYSEVPAQAQVFGLAGEMGRAFYWADWHDRAASMDVATAMSGYASEFGPAGAAAFRARAEQFAAHLRSDGWTGTGVYDAWHARGRVRKWPARTPPPPRTGAVTVYTNAVVARTLLGIPAADRVSRRGFDSAAEMGGDLHGLAQRAVAALPAPNRFRRSRKVRRVINKVRPNEGVLLARRCLRELGVHRPGVADWLGVEWWDGQVRGAASDHAQWRHMWNTIAVEALVHVAAEVAAEQGQIAL